MHALGGDPHHRIPAELEAHRAILRIATAQAFERGFVLGGVVHDRRRAADEHVFEPPPVLVVAVDDERRARVLGQVLEPPEPLPLCLPLLVDDEIDGVADQRVA